MRLPKRIFLAGRMCSGKGTIAAHLVREFGYTEVAWSDPVYFALSEETGVPTDEIKARKAEFRSQLQAIGDGRRKTFGDNYWIDQWIAATEGIEYVVESGTRYPNEAEYGCLEGQVWKVLCSQEECSRRYFAKYGAYPTAEQWAHPSEANFESLRSTLNISGAQPIEEVLRTVDKILIDYNNMSYLSFYGLYTHLRRV